MRAFLSSTYIDLIEHRAVVATALERLGQQAGRMEIFGARPEEAQTASLAEVSTSDLFIGIYAYRYGYVPAGATSSITEAEFRHARELGKPCFCFLVDDDYRWPDMVVEGDPGGTRLKLFKQEIATELVIEKFTTPDNLALKVATSVGRFLLEPMGPLVKGLRDLTQKGANDTEAERRAVAEALEAAVAVATRTLSYMANQRRSRQRDYDEERGLSGAWQTAGFQLLGLRRPEVALAERYFLKAEYWADPEAWTDERIELAQIQIDEVSRESRRVLLALQSNPDQNAV